MLYFNLSFSACKALPSNAVGGAIQILAVGLIVIVIVIVTTEEE